MTPLSPSSLAELEALARAATPGKRASHPDGAEDDERPLVCFAPDHDGPLIWSDSPVGNVALTGADARFIAACDVETILSLISEIRGWRTAAGIERTAGPARCILVEPEEPLIGRAEPAPPVKGRVSYRVDRLVPAEEIALFPSAFEYHGEEMLAELVESLRGKSLAARPYRIRISVEPEE